MVGFRVSRAPRFSIQMRKIGNIETVFTATQKVAVHVGCFYNKTGEKVTF